MSNGIYEALKKIQEEHGWDEMVKKARRLEEDILFLDENCAPDQKVDIQPLLDGVRKALTCTHDYYFSRYCGAKVCGICGDHKGLGRCYCGWSKTSPGEGRRELVEAGETIDPED